jgi:hypothetical protein
VELFAVSTGVAIAYGIGLWVVLIIDPSPGGLVISTDRRNSRSQKLDTQKAWTRKKNRSREASAGRPFGELLVCDWRAPDQAGQGRREAE